MWNIEINFGGRSMDLAENGSEYGTSTPAGNDAGKTQVQGAMVVGL